MPLSPMMQQYMQTKEKYPDCILFYRLGDFYEMFFEDAKTVSKVLELTFSKKLRFRILREDRESEIECDSLCEVFYEGEGILLVEQTPADPF